MSGESTCMCGRDLALMCRACDAAPEDGIVHDCDGALQHVALGYLARAEKAEDEVERLTAEVAKLAANLLAIKKWQGGAS